MINDIENTTMTPLSVAAVVVAAAEDDDNKQHIITANFESFEDFIARIILVPQDDDLCTGAKVAGQSSSSSSYHHDGELCTTTNNCCDSNLSEMNNIIIMKDEGHESDTTYSQQINENKDGTTAKIANEENVDCGATASTDDGSYIGTIDADKQQHQHQQVEDVPMGYILIKIITSNDNNNDACNNDDDDDDIPDDLANIEFTELFSFLRCATFPLSLLFASPPFENSMDDNDEDDDCNNDNVVVNVSDVENTSTISSKIINEISAVSRQDASKYAKQAATELRGRLSRWGYQAASIAVDAATQVKEMRDDNSKQQHMMNDDDEEHQQQHRSNNDGESELAATYDNPDIICAVSEEKKEDSVFSESGEKIDAVITKSEDMINNAVNRKSLPLDNHSSQEATVAELNRLLELKDIAITRLQQESIQSHTTKLKLEAEVQSCREAERNLMSALELSKSTDIEQEQAKAALIAGQERTVKALLNEKAVQQAAIDARDGKIVTLSNRLSEFTKRTSLQSEQLLSIEGLKNDLNQALGRCSSAEAVIVKMKEKESELTVDLAKAISKAAQLETEIEKKDALLWVSIADLSKYESENRKLKIERNCLRQRVEGLSKEMSKTNSQSLESEKMKAIIQELRSENRNLLEQIEVVKSEKRYTLAKLEATYAAHEQSVRYQRYLSTPTKVENSSFVLEDRVSELESVIASMAEIFECKEQQLSTLKQINEAILKDDR